MISDAEASAAFVWVWLPMADAPVVAGRLDREADRTTFTYGRSYLARDDAIPLYLPELPLRAGRIDPAPMRIAGCIADAGPDAWGQRVILNRHVSRRDLDTADLTALTYLLESGSDRIGALDFQASATVYVPRTGVSASLDELASAADHVERGVPLPAALDEALLHGSSIGGARPKALLRDRGRSLIAKFSSTSDPYSVVKGEFIAMELAARSGLSVAPVHLASALGKDVLLVERFDRADSGGRRGMVSALTVLGLDELGGRYASYANLAREIRRRFVAPERTLHELFARITFNILVGNTDDHARNHAAFWDGFNLTLTPAYDICPQPRSGGEATQAMAIGDDGWRYSQLIGCVERAGVYRLSPGEARAIIDSQLSVVRDNWQDVCDLAGLSRVDRAWFWGRQFLNPYCLYGYTT
jgi:serine/threonine-protein kinase HipA